MLSMFLYIGHVGEFVWIEVCGRTFTARLGYPRRVLCYVMCCVGRCAREILSLQVSSNQDILNTAVGVLDLAEQVLQEERDGVNGYL